MDAVDSIKAALKAWIAEDPEYRKMQLLTPVEVNQILDRAKKLQQQSALLDRMGA